MKPWMWALLFVAVLLAIFNVDPLENALNQQFGQNADRWGISIVLIVLIIYFFVRRK